MSIAVELAKLRETIEAHERAPYLLTVGDDGRPHSVQTGVAWNEDELEVAVGNRTLENAVGADAGESRLATERSRWLQPHRRR